MFDFLQSYSHPSFYSYNDNLSINGTFNCNCSTQGGNWATVSACVCVFVYLQCPHFTRQLPVLGFLTARFLLINWIFQLISDYWKLKLEKKNQTKQKWFTCHNSSGGSQLSAHIRRCSSSCSWSWSWEEPAKRMKRPYGTTDKLQSKFIAFCILRFVIKLFNLCGLASSLLAY